MSAAALKKGNSGVAYPEVARFYGELSALIASFATGGAVHITPKLRDSVKALKNAPEAEIAAVRAALTETATELTLLLEPSYPGDQVSRTTAAQPGDAGDDQFERLLADSLAHEPGPMVTENSKATGGALLERFRKDSAAALQERIARGEMLTSGEMQSALNIRRQSLSDAVRTGRMFSVVGPSGENYYPAFYAAPDLDRRAVEKVSKALGPLPGAVKYQFFTGKSLALGMTPLEALRKGRLPEALAAAAGFGER